MTSISKSKKNTIANHQYGSGIAFSFLYLLILIIVFLKVYPYIFDEKFDMNGDNASYYVLGSALSQGKGYTIISTPSESPANHFPPGYPIIVATVMKIFNSDIETIKKANGFFLLLSVIALFYLFYKITDNIHLGFIAALFSLINSNLLGFSTIMMSEIPFLFFTTICLILIIQIDEKIKVYKNWKFFLLILLVAISYYIRSAGLALVGGICLVFLLKKNWKYLGAFIGSFTLLVLPWYIRGKKLGGSSYVQSLLWKNPYQTELGKATFGDWGQRIYNNFTRYLTHEIHNGTLNRMSIKYDEPADVKQWLIGIVLVALIVFGLIKLQKYRFIIFSYLLGTFGIMLLWPDVWYGPRFILPVIPLLVFLIIMGSYNLLLLATQALKISNQLVCVVLLPLLFLAFIPALTPKIRAMHKIADYPYPKPYKSYFELAQWANKNIQSSANIASRKPVFFYLFSDRKCTLYRYSPEQEEVIEHLRRNNISYVVLDQLGYPSTRMYLYPAIKRYPNKFRMVKQTENSETFLFEFNPNLGYWGDWKDDQRNGHGTFVWEDGSKYEGEWKNGIKNGDGIFTFPNGYQLIGKWKDDTMNGSFILKSDEGKIIEEAIYSDNRKISTSNKQ